MPFEFSRGSKAGCRNCGLTIPPEHIRLRYRSSPNKWRKISMSCCMKCLAKILTENEEIDILALIERIIENNSSLEELN